MTDHPPITERIPRVRQRQRGDGSWRIWWEAEGSVRDLGFASVELDAKRLTWSVREAKSLNAQVKRVREGTDTPRPLGRGRTMNDLIARYRRSRRYQKLAVKTQDDYRKKILRIEAKFGKYAVSDFTKAVMHEWYEALYRDAGAWQAAALVRMCSILFSYSEILGWRPENSNPCAKLGIEAPPPRNRTAGWDELDAIVAAADAIGLPSIGTAALVSLLQGQRQTDVRKITRQAFRMVPFLDLDEGVQKQIWIFEFTRQKRSNMGQLPVHDEVLARIADWLAKVNDPDSPLLVDERSRLPYAEDEDLFQRRWVEVRAEAVKRFKMPQLAKLQFRDLRRTFGSLARAGGASKSDTADVLGNSAANNPRLGETYMAPQFQTASRAVRAVRRPGKNRKKA